MTFNNAIWSAVGWDNFSNESSVMNAADYWRLIVVRFPLSVGMNYILNWGFVVSEFGR